MRLSLWPGEAPTAPRVITRNDNAADPIPMLLALRFDMHPRPIRWRARYDETTRRHSVIVYYMI